MSGLFARIQVSMTDKTRAGLRLFALAFLILYLELALIRYTSAEVLYLGYFSNFILISVFFGLGVGFLTSHRRVRFFAWLPIALCALFGFIALTHIDLTYLRENMGQLFYGNLVPMASSAIIKLPLWACLSVIFALTALIFAGLAQEAGACFGNFSPLTAYSLDVVGSLAGITAFSLQSLASTPPIIWFIISAILIVWLSKRKAEPLAMLGLLLIGMYSVLPSHSVVWSPYQRIDIWPVTYRSELIAQSEAHIGYRLLANGVNHQAMLPFGAKEAFYDFPYTDVAELRDGKTYEDVLIIGSGSGSDTAYALKYGARRVDAVEIDPAILDAGRRLHPDQPYSDPRVTTYVDDGRAFMSRANHRYDLIIFALPDSLVTLSSFANIRLESFLFTAESIRQARSLLKPDGVLVLYNYYREQWLVDKLVGMLAQEFGHAPHIRHYQDEYRSMRAGIAIGPMLEGSKESIAEQLQPATDDWPFLYMKYPHIPAMYAWVIAIIVIAALCAIAFSGESFSGQLTLKLPFFLMGAAFLLLETKSVIQFYLIFGSTWQVNAMVFFAILALVLFANLIASRFKTVHPALYFVPLFALLLAQYLLPLELLLNFSTGTGRYLAATVLLLAPVFFSNLAFSSLFRESKAATTAFGWNIVGTMVGGAIEYTSIAFGYRTLTLLILIIYLVSFLLAYSGAKEIQSSTKPAS